MCVCVNITTNTLWRRMEWWILVNIVSGKGILPYKSKPLIITTTLTTPIINTLRPRQNGRHFADDTFKRIFMNENVRISINISLKFVPKSLINNILALLQIMAWRRPGDKP